MSSLSKFKKNYTKVMCKKNLMNSKKQWDVEVEQLIMDSINEANEASRVDTDNKKHINIAQLVGQKLKLKVLDRIKTLSMHEKKEYIKLVNKSIYKINEFVNKKREYNDKH